MSPNCVVPLRDTRLSALLLAFSGAGEVEVEEGVDQSQVKMGRMFLKIRRTQYPKFMPKIREIPMKKILTFRASGEALGERTVHTLRA